MAGPTASCGSGQVKAQQLAFEGDGGRFLSGKAAVPSRPATGDEADFGGRQLEPVFSGLLAHEDGKGGERREAGGRQSAPFKQAGLQAFGDGFAGGNAKNPFMSG